MSERVIQARVRRGRDEHDEQDEKLMEIGMEIATNPQISFLDQLKIEAGVLVPLLNALRAELGEQRADRLVTAALREARRKAILRAGALMPGSPKERWEMLNELGMQKIGADVDFDVLKEEPEAFDVDITGCRFAELFRALGEQELGAVLVCECDDHIVEVGSPDVEYTRTQTIMKGATCCNFRFRMTSDESSKPD